MEEQAAIDRILETENLTDNLEDQEANWLLDWGIKRLPGLIAGIEDDEAAGAKVNELMTVMRQVNRIMGGRDSMGSDELVEAIQALVDKYERLVGTARKASPDDFTSLSPQIVEKSALDAIQFLVEWIAPASQG
jgi:hypothetical protein